jgi:hypothetical protein
MMTILLVLIEPKIGNTEERSLKEYLLDKTINHRHDESQISPENQEDKQ